MTELQIIEQILDKQLEKGSRFEAIKDVLDSHNISFDIESCGKDCNNIVIPMTEEEEYVLLVAHYDLYPGSTGINDNTASIATLINVINHFKENNPEVPFKVLLPDKEESGMIGSRMYGYVHKKEIIHAIVLDIIGYGDHLIFGTRDGNYFDFLLDHAIKKTDRVLPSDNLTFAGNGIKSTLIVAIHDEDITLVPEDNYFMIGDHPKFYESFHNRAMDGKLEIINFPLIEKLKKALINILTEGDENESSNKE